MGGAPGEGEADVRELAIEPHVAVDGAVVEICRSRLFAGHRADGTSVINLDGAAAQSGASGQHGSIA
jgi:hypothetical protein